MAYQPVARIMSHEADVLKLVFDSARIWSLSVDSSLSCWNLATCEIVQSIRSPTSVPSDFLVEGNLLMFAHNRGVSFYDSRTRENYRLSRESEPTSCIGLIPYNANYVATSTLNGCVKIIDRRNGMSVRRFAAHNSPITSLSCCFHDAVLATAGADGSTRLWNVFDGDCLRTFCSPARQPCTFVDFIDSSHIGVLLGDNSLLVVHFEGSCERLSALPVGKSTKNFTYSGSRNLVVPASDGGLNVLDLTSNSFSESTDLKGHTDDISYVAVSGNVIATSGYGSGSYINLWMRSEDNYCVKVDEIYPQIVGF
jgi:WD40 repeat protein